MTDIVVCTRCQRTLPDDAPQGSCPTCLLQMGLQILGDITPDRPSTPSTIELEGSTNNGGAGPSQLERFPDAPVLTNYELLEEIGHGGMGRVYKAWQHGADRIVAIKIIKGGANIDREQRERFGIEIRVLARLQHPNIVQVYEVGEEAGCPFFSMEYVEPGNLATQIKRAPWSLERSARLVETLATTMQAAHEEGILHRDLKPANILLTREGIPKITDFGLAKQMEIDEGQTPSGVMLGTPSYMAPEQAAQKNREVGPTADVYALGATLYEMLTGVPPFRGKTPLQTVVLVLTTEVSPPSRHRPGIPADLEAICLKCLEKEPGRRYAQAAELAEDLGRWRRGESTQARPLHWPALLWRVLRRRAPVLFAGFCGLATLLAISAVLFYSGPEVDPQPRETPLPVPAVPPPDPDAPLREIQAELRQGKKVTLIDKIGKPRWYRWERGAGTIATSPYGDEVFYYESISHSFLLLLVDPQVTRFCLHAEIRQTGSSTERLNGIEGPPETEVAICAGYQNYPLPPPYSAASVLGVFFSERPGPPEPGQTVQRGMAIFAQYCWFQKPNESMKPRRQKTGLINFLLDPPPPPRPWRKIIIEVRPDQIQAFWVTPKRKLSFPTLTRTGMVEATAYFQNDLNKNRLLDDFRIKVEMPQPRLGIGVAAEGCAVSLKNVVLEPMVN